MMKKTALGILLSALLLLSTILCSCSSAVDSGLPLSPAINCIAEQSSMAKSALVGQSISFSADDFARAVNKHSIKEVTFTSLPPVSDGELRVGSTVLSAKQTISSDSLSLLTYHPSGTVNCSELRFRVDDSPYELCCKLYSLQEPNHAPTLSAAPSTSLQVSTYKNVTLFDTLTCYDPDGDDTVIEIVSYPEKGLLVLENSSTGSYRYIPNENSIGKDSFCYVAKDKYGNYSSSATVSLNIKKQGTSVQYVDLDESPYHNSAITMTEKGIMSGTQVGSYTYFYPDTAVSRAEFTMMALEAAGISEVKQVTSTVFDDDADIPSNMKGYVATAYELGYVKGSMVDGELCFLPNKEITRAEAAVMLGNMLDAATPTITPVFSDSEDIPTWARPSVYSLSAMGVLESSDGNISPTSNVTRGDAANMLVNFMSVR